VKEKIIEKLNKIKEGELVNIIFIDDKITPQTKESYEIVYAGKSGECIEFIERGLAFMDGSHIIKTYSIGPNDILIEGNNLLLKWSKIYSSEISSGDAFEYRSRALLEEFTKKNKLLLEAGR